MYIGVMHFAIFFENIWRIKYVAFPKFAFYQIENYYN